METVLVEWGLPALFCISFLAATVLPIASEWLLAAIVVQPVDMTAAVAVATAGNTPGRGDHLGRGMVGAACGSCSAGCGSAWRTARRAESWYTRWGSWSLLLAWAPVVGDPLCLVAGLFKVPLIRFIPLVAVGKAGRYLVIAWAARQLMA